MKKKEFNEIINFAINREKEAIKFYRDLQKLVSFENKKEMLRSLEEIEKVHIDVLKSIRLKTMKNVFLPTFESLDVSDFIVEAKPTANMSYQDILMIAIRREEKSYLLYTKLADESKDQEIKKLFLRLAAEEAGHKLHFEKIYDEYISPYGTFIIDAGT